MNHICKKLNTVIKGYMIAFVTPKETENIGSWWKPN